MKKNVKNWVLKLNLNSSMKSDLFYFPLFSS